MDYAFSHSKRSHREKSRKPSMRAFWSRGIPPVGGKGCANLRACLKMERGCVEDQPQHGQNTPKPRSFAAGCGWSRTTQPRSGIFRQALRDFSELLRKPVRLVARGESVGLVLVCGLDG